MVERSDSLTFRLLTMVMLPFKYVVSLESLYRLQTSTGQFASPELSEQELTIRSSPLQWVVDHLFSNSFWLNYNRKLHLDIRRRAIRKREREAAKSVKAE